MASILYGQDVLLCSGFSLNPAGGGTSAVWSAQKGSHVWPGGRQAVMAGLQKNFTGCGKCVAEKYLIEQRFVFC